jgi:hypothetical protein
MKSPRDITIVINEMIDHDNEAVWEIATQQVAPLRRTLIAMRDQLDL